MKMKDLYNELKEPCKSCMNLVYLFFGEDHEMNCFSCIADSCYDSKDHYSPRPEKSEIFVYNFQKNTKYPTRISESPL